MYPCVYASGSSNEPNRHASIRIDRCQSRCIRSPLQVRVVFEEGGRASENEGVQSEQGQLQFDKIEGGRAKGLVHRKYHVGHLLFVVLMLYRIG